MSLRLRLGHKERDSLDKHLEMSAGAEGLELRWGDCHSNGIALDLRSDGFVEGVRSSKGRWIAMQVTQCASGAV